MCWSWEVSLTFSMLEFVAIAYLAYRNKYIDKYWIMFLTPIAIQEFMQFVTWKWGIDENTTVDHCNQVNFISSRITLIFVNAIPFLFNMLIVKTIWRGMSNYIKILWKISLAFSAGACIIMMVAELLDDKHCIYVGIHGHLDWEEVIKNGLYEIIPSDKWLISVQLFIILYWSVPQALSLFLYRPQWIIFIQMLVSIIVFFSLFIVMGSESFSVYCWVASYFSFCALIYVPIAPYLLSKYSTTVVDDGNCFIKFCLKGAHDHWIQYGGSVEDEM
eukprot:785984_1